MGTNDQRKKQNKQHNKVEKDKYDKPTPNMIRQMEIDYRETSTGTPSITINMEQKSNIPQTSTHIRHHGHYINRQQTRIHNTTQKNTKP